MPIHGDTRTMPLVELLQWIASNEKTGVLRLERNKIHKQISFQQGRVAGCFDGDPSTRIGQFLISHGKITERTLQFALRHQKTTGDRMSDILIEMGVVTEEEISALIASKAREAIYGMFEWDEAIFNFELDSAIDRYEIAVDLSIEETLTEGATRQNELRLFRAVFANSWIVLRRTDQPLSPDVENGALLLQVLELVDGERSLAEILAVAHASEYQVLKLLFNLQNSRNIEIVEERERPGSATTLIDVRTDDAPIPLPSLAEFSDEPADAASEEPSDLLVVDDSPRAGAAPATKPAGEEAPLPEASIEQADLHMLLQISAAKWESGDHEGALLVLDACYKARPHDESLRERMAKTEAAYLETLSSGPLQLGRVPQRVDSAEAHTVDLSPDQTTVLGMVDGNLTIQSLVWVAPLREIQVLRALGQLFKMGLIRIDDVDDAAAAATADTVLEIEIVSDPPTPGCLTT